MQRQGYEHRETAVQEHILRAVEIRLERQHFGIFRARQQLKLELFKDFIYIKPLVEKLKEFEKQRDKYNITFTDFMPELLNTLEELYEMEYWKQGIKNAKSLPPIRHLFLAMKQAMSNSKQSNFDCHCFINSESASVETKVKFENH